MSVITSRFFRREILISADAMAQALLRRSIELFCAKRAKVAGAAVNDLFGACVEAEWASLEDLRDNWTAYSLGSRARYLKVFGAGGLYSDIEACIEAAEALRFEMEK